MQLVTRVAKKNMGMRYGHGFFRRMPFVFNLQFSDLKMNVFLRINFTS
jgi:hypothetical protein